MDISWSSMVWGFIIVSIPIFFLNYYRTGLSKDAFIAVIRMSIQLFFVVFYLKYMFKLNLWWVNLIWVLIMIIIASSFDEMSSKCLLSIAEGFSDASISSSNCLDFKGNFLNAIRLFQLSFFII